MMRPEDWSGLAPERDRPQGPEFDWQPEALNLSAAAGLLVHFSAVRGSDGSPMVETYTAMLALWAELCGMDEAASFTYAVQIADAAPPVMGTVPPF